MRYKPELANPTGDAVYRDLRRLAMRHRRNPQSVATRFILERVVARLFAGPHADRFALKGGLVFLHAEGVGPLDARSTSDIDIHIPAFDGTLAELKAIVGEALAAPQAEDDGVRFDLPTLEVAPARTGDAAGASLSVEAQVGSVGLKVFCDVGFDHRPALEHAIRDELPAVLPGRFAPVVVNRIPFSWVVGDKLSAMVRHGNATTRLRDYYDLYVILSREQADLGEVPDAIARTFRLFGDAIPADADEILALDPRFAEAHAAEWLRETKRRDFAVETPPLPELCAYLRERLGPLVAEAHAQARADEARPA